MPSNRKIPDSWRSGWKAKACTSFALYLKVFKNHLYYLWHVRVFSIKPRLHTQLSEHNVPVNSKTAHPPGQSPGIWLALSSVQWGIWPKWGPPGGAFDFPAVGNKRISQFFDSARKLRWRVIALVDSTWVFLLLSFYTVISWNMPLFKAWSEDKLNKKFVVAENFSELVSKGKRFCFNISKGQRLCFPWRVGDLTLWSSNGWGIWPSKLVT